MAGSRLGVLAAWRARAVRQLDLVASGLFLMTAFYLWVSTSSVATGCGTIAVQMVVLGNGAAAGGVMALALLPAQPTTSHEDTPAVPAPSAPATAAAHT